MNHSFRLIAGARVEMSIFYATSKSLADEKTISGSRNISLIL